CSMWCEHDIVHLMERISGFSRFDLHHVQTRTSELPLVECADQVRLDVGWTPSSVDEIGGRFHAAEQSVIEQAATGLVERQVRRNEVSATEQLGQVRHALNAMLAENIVGDERVPPDHLHIEAVG